MELSNNERRMLKAMRIKPDEVWQLDELLDACEWNDQAHVAGAGGSLSESGLVIQTEERSKIWRLAEEGNNAAENGLLELVLPQVLTHLKRSFQTPHQR